MTVPAAPLSNVTVLLAVVVSNPYPKIRTVVALAARIAVLLSISGMTVATCTAEPLLTEFEVTTAFSKPASSGEVVNATVSDVLVAAVTTPAAPLFKVTLLFETMGSKPVPVITISGAVTERLDVDDVTVTPLSIARASSTSNGKP